MTEYGKLIDVDALIRRLIHGLENTHQIPIPMWVCLEILNAPTIKLDQHWIPCSERLPEEDEEVFVYLFKDSPYIAYMNDGDWYTEEFIVDKEEEPIAWMPLPELYKEEGEQ